MSGYIHYNFLYLRISNFTDMKVFLRIVFCFLLVKTSLTMVYSQRNVDVKTLIRYELDSINGVYIPYDINDAIEQIDSFWNDSIKQDIKKMSENEFLGNSHFSLGMWMRNNWGLWRGSKLSNYFNKLQVFHPDDVSSIILTSYYRYLSKQEIEFEKQIIYYINYWQKENSKNTGTKQKDKKQKKIKHNPQRYKKKQTVYFDYPYGFSSEEEENYYSMNNSFAKGKIIDIDLDNQLLKIKLLKCYNSNGVIIYDTAYGEVLYKDEEYDNNGRIIAKNGRQIFYMKEGDEFWFSYNNDYWILKNEI